ncbi:hypothetical protein GF358_03610 [Candidatus Woesearchaeota archaeon]|nr:hypothetical protein [Candidatus Woesearchaeota archaeon]
MAKRKKARKKVRSKKRVSKRKSIKKAPIILRRKTKKARKINRKKVAARRVKLQKAPVKPRSVKISLSRCKKCKVPLKGIGHKLIAGPFFGIKPSKKKKGHCNKCE